MKIFVEDYRGQVINYDDNTDKFTCDITVEDSFKTSNRKSLNDIRKEIDSFLKANVNFKPFKIIHADGYNPLEPIEVVGIRSDGKILLKKSKNYTSQENIKDIEEKYRMFNPDLYESFLKIKKERDEANDIYESEKKKILLQARPIDLSKYKHLIK